jgi:hypothetical protein
MQASETQPAADESIERERLRPMLLVTSGAGDIVYSSLGMPKTAKPKKSALASRCVDITLPVNKPLQVTNRWLPWRLFRCVALPIP